MNIGSHFLEFCEPRGWLICRTAEHWVGGQVGQQENYAARVVDIYEARTQPDERAIRFHHTDDAIADRRANRQLVMRIVRKEVQLKSDLEEALVLALPEKPRKELRRLLAARYGELAVPIPDNSPAGASADLSRALKEFGEWVEATGKLLEGDMVISEADPMRELEEALAETDEAVGAILGLRWAIDTAIKKKVNGKAK